MTASPLNYPEILAIRTMTLPRDTNANGTIFGGHILSLIDQAGAIAAHTVGGRKLVTVAMRQVEFKEPVNVGDIITCFAQITHLGRTSLTCTVRVVAQNPNDLGINAGSREVTAAEVVYVNIDENGRPLALQST